MINPLAHTEFAIHYKFEDVQDGRIQMMTFSYDGHLYVLLYTLTEEIHYCFNVKEDFNHRKANNAQLLDFKAAKEISRLPRDHKNSHSSYDMHVCEEELGVTHIVYIIE